jgi:hypothetical protein
MKISGESRTIFQMNNLESEIITNKNKIFDKKKCKKKDLV